jgi:hypothetical protein
MLRQRVMRGLTVVGLGAMLTVGMGAWGVASAASQGPVQVYTGLIREINIDQCGLEPGTCEGSLVLAQASGQEVALAIPAGTTIQRGGHRVRLEELGVGNYVIVQAAPLSPVPQGHGRDWTWGQIDRYEHSPLEAAPRAIERVGFPGADATCCPVTGHEHHRGDQHSHGSCNTVPSWKPHFVFAASGPRCLVTGAHPSGEGSPSVPLAVCHPYGQHTLCQTTPPWHTVCGRATHDRASARRRGSPRVAGWRRGAPKLPPHDGVRSPGAVGPARLARLTVG